MLFWMSSEWKNSANAIARQEKWIAGQQHTGSFFSKETSLEKTAYFDDSTVSCTDSMVTLIGHTDDGGQTIENKTPAQIAQQLADKYKGHELALTEVFLIACESGMKTTSHSILFSKKEASFAQKLAAELKKRGFVTVVYAATPPEKAHSMRVNVSESCNAIMAGKVRGVASMNTQTTEYLDAVQAIELDTTLRANQQTKAIQQLKRPDNYQTEEVMPHHSKGYKMAFRENPRNKYEPLDSTPRAHHDVDLDALLESGGILNRILYAIFGSPVITNMLAKQLRIVKEEEVGIQEQISVLKSDISSDLAHKNGASIYGKNEWDCFKDYINLKNVSWHERQQAWAAFSEYSGTFNTEKKSLGTHTYKACYEKLHDFHKKFEQAALKKQAIKTNLMGIIEDYLSQHELGQDSLHDSKIRIMNVIKAHLENPNKTPWTAVESATSDPENINWQKGLFSQVRDIHEKTAEFVV